MLLKKEYFNQNQLKLRGLTHKRILQRLPVRLVQLKIGSTFENLLNKICQII